MKTKTIKNTLLIALVAVFSLGLIACGSESDPNNNNSETGGAEPVGIEEEQPEPVADIPQLNGVQTKVTLDKGFVKALGQLKLTPGVVENGALVDKGAALAFPITGGNVTYYDPAEDYRPYVQGTIMHDNSGLSLKSGKTLVELTDFVVDPGTSELTGTVSVNGKVAAEDVLIFKLDGSTLNPLQVNEQEGTAVLEGTQVLISDEAAQLLNQTFKTNAVKGGLLVGIAEITVQLPA